MCVLPLPVLVLAAHSPPPQLNIHSKNRRDAPEWMSRGSAVTVCNTIYCISEYSYTIYSYQVDKDEWEEHCECTYRNTALTIINGYLTAIGGVNEGGQITNKVVSWKGGRWEEEVPPMRRARYQHAVVNDGCTVVVAGGAEEEESVEVFNGSSWSSVAGLPHDLLFISATLCADQMYIMDYLGRTFSASITTLLSTRPTDTPSPSTPSTHSTWRPLNTAPVTSSTLSTIGSQVVVVGGRRGGDPPTADVHGLTSGLWSKIGSMNTVRDFPIVAVVNGDRMVVVGSLTHTAITTSTTSSSSSSTSSTSTSRVAVELVLLC